MKDIHSFLCTPAESTQRHGPHDRIVMSSRVRLARNLREFAFPGWAKKPERMKVLEVLLPAVSSLPEMADSFAEAMDNLSALDKQLLVERHLISREHAAKSSGSGLVLETEVSAPPPYVQPVLDYQAVAIRLARLRAPAGRRTTLTGEATPALAGQSVTLERRISAGEWSNISLSHESAAGAFSFTVPGVSEAYRVMVADEPGYYMVGYSNVVTLTAVVPPKHKS